MRRLPVRTCVGCRARDARGVLTRLVAHEGRLAVDATGAAPGRGAWMHARAACLEVFARKGGFVRSLRCVIPKPERVALRMQLSEVQD
ncbi:MAG TPA: YlxR family protein [Candidatus Binatia bacterium]